MIRQICSTAFLTATKRSGPGKSLRNLHHVRADDRAGHDRTHVNNCGDPQQPVIFVWSEIKPNPRITSENRANQKVAFAASPEERETNP